MFKENFVINSAGKRLSVILPIKDYKKILDELEELEDIRAYDATKAKKSKVIPFEQAVKEIESKRKK
ncbi:MAG: hypothetical protein COX07_07870 [Bacteroidetes bacterium CG23_combo_of_CG06-09_8_20_14_all_32_9]|nr:MAG: hypothetical protein COX07_07870 [Bacteroidetes bacterium CG23_combo_of_CG06-09_8_20_14_all_32_9]